MSLPRFCFAFFEKGVVAGWHKVQILWQHLLEQVQLLSRCQIRTINIELKWINASIIDRQVEILQIRCTVFPLNLSRFAQLE